MALTVYFRFHFEHDGHKGWIVSGAAYNYDNKNKLMSVLLFLFIVKTE